MQVAEEMEDQGGNTLKDVLRVLGANIIVERMSATKYRAGLKTSGGQVFIRSMSPYAGDFAATAQGATPLFAKINLCKVIAGRHVYTAAAPNLAPMELRVPKNLRLEL